MTPDQLLTFALVADLGNISRAADQLHLSQPAVSGQLRALQEWFGEPLYRRSGHGIALTDAGTALATVARQLRQVTSQASSTRDAWRGLETGVLRLGASTTPASYLLPPLVAEFRRRFPAVRIFLFDGNTHDIVERLPGLDMAFIEGDVPDGLPPDTSVHAWREDEVVAIVAAGHPLAGKRETTLADLAGDSLVMREPGSGVRRLVERAFEQAGFRPAIALELAGVEGVKHAVRAGLGVGFVSIMSMQHEDGTLSCLKILPSSLRRTLRILIPHTQSLARAAVNFRDLCVSEPQGAIQAAASRASQRRASSIQ